MCTHTCLAAPQLTRPGQITTQHRVSPNRPCLVKSKLRAIGERVVNAVRFAGRLPLGDTSPPNVEADSQLLAYGRNKWWPRRVTDHVRAKEER
jgi:hypothetical protein